ncbi:cardiomyopathy-associated protein 5 [Mugil cephalus]|uniref:cardiomyopathy-associated protein 5 n=1 Tax=Mugil cephalus TaxID=48193 RepID=UPI001FB786BE|nr:cardiomyopathy-associated protein 5 [Mugil cephalus]
MEECESVGAEVTELQEFQSEASDAVSQDDEDELEELQNSLREVVQDQSVKPKLQCLMVDPSFSMVTVQSEDSGIVWETASSRCSTPWASETSSVSDTCSMEGSGAAGKITIVFDEDKIVRRRTRSGGRSSRLGDRLSRPGSSRSASALGTERPEMAEVSIPNIKQETTKTEPDLEEIKNKDQQLFSLISEGYEILNIRVPTKLPTVDEEESTELQDNLSYLNQTPKIRSRNHHDWTKQQNGVVPEDGKTLDHLEPSEQDSSQPSVDTEDRQTPTQKETTSDFDYFEKFTLLDEVVPGEKAPEQQEVAKQSETKPQAGEQKPAQKIPKDNLSTSEDSFVFVTDVDIVGEHLDEVFYGEGAPANALQHRGEDKEDEEARIRSRRESQRSTKESGSVLFESEETTLTPIFISSGPPKIIDPILLEEPTAMSFMYSDLYEDALGERRRSDEECSEAESVVSEKSYRRRLSDSEEADGYLEKFTLKDEIPTVEVKPESEEDAGEGRKMWGQNKFEMTGCLIRVVKEDDGEKTEGQKVQEVSVGGNGEALPSGISEEKKEIVTDIEKDGEEAQFSVVQEQPLREATKESKPMEEKMEKQHMKHEAESDQTEAPEPVTEKPLADIHLVSKAEETEESEDHQTPCETQEVAEKQPDVLVVTTEKTAAVSSGVAPAKVITDTKIEVAGETLVSGAKEEASAEMKEPETVEQEMLTFAEPITETLVSEKKEAAEVAPEDKDAPPVEVVTDCASALHTVVEVTEKVVNDKEIQTQVQIDLQEATSVETTDVPEGEKQHESLTEEPMAVKIMSEAVVAEQESVVQTDISRDVTRPVKPEEAESDTDKKTLESEQQEQPVTIKSKIPAEDSKTLVQDTVNVGDEIYLLVPKGKAVEMDIEINQWSEDTTEDIETLQEPDITWTRQVPVEETKTEPQLEVEPEAAVKEEPLRNHLELSPLVPLEEAEEQETEREMEEDEVALSPLRSFAPQEDLSVLHREDMQPEETDTEQKAEMHKTEDVPVGDIIKEDLIPCVDVHRDGEGEKMVQDEGVAVAPEVTVDELEYEVISTQDAKDMPEPETQTDAEELSDQKHKEQVDAEKEEKVDVFPEEELIEADYEIIDAEEENQARLAAELQGMDWFCVTCGCLLSEDDCVSGDHRSHEINSVDKAYEEIKERLSGWISELQGRSENIEDLVSELELAYNSVEDQCVESEAAMQAQNEEMMALVMEQYNNMSVSMEEEKKAKLEQLYDQIVSFQENIDSAKATLETTARESETDACSPEDIHERLKAALDSALSLELGPKSLMVFEDYAKANTSSSNMAQRKGIPVPQRPTLQPQEPGSATSTSVTVYWKVNPGDIIDCFQVYCMEDPQGAVSEEYRVTVKESYCVLEELDPDKVYKVWVMAVNYTGCSLPSDRLVFRTAPSVPAIDTERCTVMWDSATLRWSSAKQSPEQSYTLEYCRQYELEGEGLRSLSGIKICEQRVLLQPNENYLFYIKAVNEAGSSEQSEAALISTRGTRFHLLKGSAHPALELSEDQTTLHYSQHAYNTSSATDKECPSVLGELLPAGGRYYWETIVSGSTAYRLGVVHGAPNRNGSLGENSASWCLQCVPTPSGCRYQLLHNDIQSSVFVVEMPERVGTLLDYQLGLLSFYNTQSGQLLGSVRQHFTQPCHPALALELPGRLEVSMVLEAPEFTKDS